MENPIVKCNVANCTFWGEGNRCHAESILVEIDAHADNKYMMETSAEPYLHAEHEDSAAQKADTCCHTFRPRTEKKHK